eukprot:1721490-Pleurochrysis_carterae.AAC.1
MSSTSSSSALPLAFAQSTSCRKTNCCALLFRATSVTSDGSGVLRCLEQGAYGWQIRNSIGVSDSGAESARSRRCCVAPYVSSRRGVLNAHALRSV